MIRLAIYDNTKNYFTPDMNTLTPEKAAMEYPVVNAGLECVIQTDVNGIMFYTVPKPVSMVADEHGLSIGDYQNTDELLRAVEDIMNTPPPEPQPSAEERIAATLEFQSVLLIPDEVEV